MKFLGSRLSRGLFKGTRLLLLRQVRFYGVFRWAWMRGGSVGERVLGGTFGKFHFEVEKTEILAQ